MFPQEMMQPQGGGLEAALMSGGQPGMGGGQPDIMALIAMLQGQGGGTPDLETIQQLVQQMQMQGGGTPPGMNPMGGMPGMAPAPPPGY